MIEVNTSVGLSLPSLGARSFTRSGSIDHLEFSCITSPAYSGTAVQMTDMKIAPSLSDLTVSKCNIAFDLVNTTSWTERLVATNLTDYYNNHFFYYDQNISDTANSYGYGTYAGIYINKGSSQDVFYLTNGAYLYHSTFLIKGNFGTTTGASIFNVQGVSGAPCPGAAGNVYDIAVEGSGYSVVSAANNACTSGPTGNVMVQGNGSINATGAIAATNGLINDINSAVYLVGTVTTTAAASNTVTNLTNNVIPQSTCYVTPSNAVAASLQSATFVSAVSWGSVTISHPSTAGGVFQLWCT